MRLWPRSDACKVQDEVCLRLGARLREFRKDRGWRQIDLSQHSGVHEVHISDLERGTREGGLRTLVALAKALEITLSDLVLGIERNEGR